VHQQFLPIGSEEEGWRGFIAHSGISKQDQRGF
jgi:hypothetical protein